VSLPARLLAGLLGLLLAVAAGWRQGVRHTLADWRAAELAESCWMISSLISRKRLSVERRTYCWKKKYPDHYSE
jgi:hypothetical protein